MTSAAAPIASSASGTRRPGGAGAALPVSRKAASPRIVQAPITRSEAVPGHGVDVGRGRPSRTPGEHRREDHEVVRK